MNSEPIVLRMNNREADSVAFVLMTALGMVSMLTREREDVTKAANLLFEQLGYKLSTTDHGQRLELA